MNELPNLTVKEKALIHIYLQRAPGWAMEYSESLTQKGIAEEVGVSRAHMAQCLISLEKEGKIDSRKSRVTGHKRKLKTYKLLEPGRKDARDLCERLEESELELSNDKTLGNVTFGELLDEYDFPVFQLYDHCIENNLEGLFDDEEDDEEDVVEEIKEENDESNDLPPPHLGFYHDPILMEGSREIPKRKEGYAKAVIGLLLLFSIIPSLFFLMETGSEILCLYPLFSLLAGLTLMASYFSKLDERKKGVEQIFSFSILFNSFFVLLFVYSEMYYGQDIISEIPTYFFVLVSLFLAIFFTHKSESQPIRGLPYIFGSFLMAYGFTSTLSPDHTISSSIGMFWILGGAFVLDAGVRWNDDVRWTYILFGLGAYAVIWSVLWIQYENVSPETTLVSILWIALVTTIFLLYLLREEKREEMTMRLWNAVPIVMGTVFAFIAVLLFMGERYIEGAVELGLGVMFLFELFKGDIDLKESVYWGAPIALLSALTIIVIFMV